MYLNFCSNCGSDKIVGINGIRNDEAMISFCIYCRQYNTRTFDTVDKGRITKIAYNDRLIYNQELDNYLNEVKS